MCRIIKTKSETLALILRAQYVDEVWKKEHPAEPPKPSLEEVKVLVSKPLS